MDKTLPPSVLNTFKLLGVILLVYTLHKLDDVLLPVLYAAVFAFLLVPISRRLEGWRWPRWLATLLSILLLASILATIVWLVANQLLDLTSDWARIKTRLMQQYEVFRHWAYARFGMATPNRQALLASTLESLTERGSSIFGSAANITTTVIENLALIVVYVFCFLYYRDHFRQFLFRVVKTDQRTGAMHVVHKIEEVTQSYLAGLLLVILIVAMLNITGLLLLQVRYAIFFGIVASLLAIIPFIGMSIGASLPALYTLIETGSPLRALGVVVMFLGIQFLEGNFITPGITGHKVSINPLAAIMGLILGGQLWGLPGMILSIPIVAVLKVVFDVTPGMEPYGFLLGDISNNVISNLRPPGVPPPTRWMRLKHKLWGWHF